MKTLADKEDLIFSPPRLGCVLYVPGLPGGASKTYDRTPYGDQGTIAGATWVRLPSGIWCLSFDGQDDYVSCGSVSALDMKSTNFTVLLWINSINTGVNKGAFSLVSSGGGHIWFKVPHSNIAILHAQDDAANFAYRNGSTPVSDGKWHCVAATIDWSQSQGIHVYVDGELDDGSFWGDLTNFNPAQFTLSDVRIGRGVQANQVTNGLIGSVFMFNHILTPLEIRRYYEREKHLYGVW